jgi:hypothetical protein
MGKRLATICLFMLSCGDSTEIQYRRLDTLLPDLATFVAPDEASTPGDKELPAPDLLSNDEPVDPPEAGCPPFTVCVTQFPFTHSGDTALAEPGWMDFYSCDPDIDESGNEQVYRVTVPKDGFLSAAVSDAPGVDVDVHILSALDPQACLDRGHHHAGADVEAGDWYVVVDTFVQDGLPLAGQYTIEIGFIVPSEGKCEQEAGIMERVGDGGDHLLMPATGPVVLEAHLVTNEEPPPYPATSTQKLLGHYELSQLQSGLVMHRTQHWAPLEGGSFYGAGISSPTLFPVLDEHWYVCMYWTNGSRPERGTRMILREPGGQRAVVVAAGYETGPGNLDNIAGTTEETHFYLGSGHKSTLTLGIAMDQDLPLGPRQCD